MMKKLMFWSIITMIILLMAPTPDTQATTQTEKWLEQFIVPFTDPRIKRIDHGDLRSNYDRQLEANVIKIKAKDISGGNPRDGFAGICIENVPGTVPLTNFNFASATFSASARMLIDVKLEQRRGEDGIVLLDGSKELIPGDNQMHWEFRKKRDSSSQQDTLSKVKRLCVFILADEFPKSENEVELDIGHFEFGR